MKKKKGLMKKDEEYLFGGDERNYEIRWAIICFDLLAHYPN